MTKQKSLSKIFEWIIICYKNVAEDSFPYFPLSGRNKSLTIKIQQLVARFLTCFGLKLQVKRRIEQFNFFDWFSNLKNLVISNGSKP